MAVGWQRATPKVAGATCGATTPFFLSFFFFFLNNNNNNIVFSFIYLYIFLLNNDTCFVFVGLDVQTKRSLLNYVRKLSP
jgi:hypothetical protein